VSKKDKNPYVWGKFPLSEILAEAKAAKSQRKTKTAPGEFSEKKRAERIFKKCKDYDNFLDLREDPVEGVWNRTI